ncbi:hypothetical protein FGO68_gene5640 [Halteria grandinella]|uniref:Uncharacterized protein n=1 Tax=Halteria grandinella TaxID=5974 RepID=A0A8J8T7W9_HALGN|nr:hypothetical protein FGO68_gene5640 [Halteria grandinella]
MTYWSPRFDLNIIILCVIKLIISSLIHTGHHQKTSLSATRLLSHHHELIADRAMLMSPLSDSELLEGPQSGFICVGDVEEAVSVLPLLIDMGHEGVSLEQVASVDEEVERVLLRELYALPDDVVEVVRGQVVWHEVLTWSCRCQGALRWKTSRRSRGCGLGTSL